MSQMSHKHAAVIDAIAGRYPSAEEVYVEALKQLKLAAEQLYQKTGDTYEVRCLYDDVYYRRRCYPTLDSVNLSYPNTLRPLPVTAQLAVLHIQELFPEFPLQFGMDIDKGLCIPALSRPIGNIGLSKLLGHYIAPHCFVVWSKQCKTLQDLQITVCHEVIHDFVNWAAIKKWLPSENLIKNPTDSFVSVLAEGLTTALSYVVYTALVSVHPEFYEPLPPSFRELLGDSWAKTPEMISYRAATAIGYAILQILGKDRARQIFFQGRSLSNDERACLKRPLNKLAGFNRIVDFNPDSMPLALGDILARYQQSYAAWYQAKCSIGRHLKDYLPFDSETAAIEQELNELQIIFGLIAETKNIRASSLYDEEICPMDRLWEMLSTQDGLEKIKDAVPPFATGIGLEKITFVETTLDLQLTTEEMTRLITGPKR